MKRKNFLKTLLGASTLITMDGFSHLVNAVANYNSINNKASEFASYGAVHLNITDLNKTRRFWTEIVGLKERKTYQNKAEFGTKNKTLVVVHQTAKKPFKKGYSGLYHFAIHAPNVTEFARMINRLNVHRYPYSPIDHTMSQSIYLDDPDGINVEFTLETPERFKRVISTGGLKVEGADGIIRSASERLDVTEFLTMLKDKDISKLISNDSYIGHLHLYANNVEHSNTFYQSLGYEQFNYLPEYMYADLGTGGDYQHRIAMNSWHGQNRPLAPNENAGLRHFQINYENKGKLFEVLKNVSNYEKIDEGYLLYDSTGNKIVLKNG